jgi:hypothetical protein
MRRFQSGDRDEIIRGRGFLDPLRFSMLAVRAICSRLLCYEHG